MPFQKGSKHFQWKGGRWQAATGYVYVKMPDHPNAMGNGYVAEHALVMSSHIGRPIGKGEIVHHINGIRHDNRINNLIVMTNAKHTSHHTKGGPPRGACVLHATKTHCINGHKLPSKRNKRGQRVCIPCSVIATRKWRNK